ncbi:MAG: chorismate mutase [Alphaproteobacteria bacterium]|nr:chorismate mutase [Alphaproteobacteria bacterium]
MDSLNPYRERIDALDDQIIALLAARYDVIREVGHFKAARGISPILPDRVVAVRERAVQTGAERGLDPDFVRRLYTLMIDHAHDIEKSIIHG